MNLSLIMVVGTLLSLIIIFEQQYFSSFNQSLLWRKTYLQNFYPLLDEFITTKDDICANEIKVKTKTIYLDKLQQHELKHGFYCRKISLFNKFQSWFLTTGVYKRINLDNLKLFNNISYDLNVKTRKDDPKFLIIEGVDKWELNHTFYGLIWVKNDLVISGVGSIRGQIISDAKVDYSAIRTRVYRIREHLDELDRQYSYIEYIPRSWHDFYNTSQ